MRVVVAALVVALATPVHADDDLAEARRLEAALDYQHALAIVDRAIAHGGADPGQLVELHMLAGKLAAGLDHMLIAEDHFARALALAPDVALPDGTSPKITAPFYAARAASKPLRITAARSGDRVTLAVDGDPLAIVAGIAVHVVDATREPAELIDRHALTIQVSAGATVTDVAALDASGNRAWIGALALPAPAPRPAAPPALAIGKPVPASAPPIYARWTTWAAVGTVALAAGGVSAWRFGAAQDEWNELRAQSGQHDYSELRAVEDRGRQWGLAANVGFGVAAAAGVIAVIELVIHRDEPARVALTPRGLDVAGRF